MRPLQRFVGNGRDHFLQNYIRITIILIKNKKGRIKFALFAFNIILN